MMAGGTGLGVGVWAPSAASPAKESSSGSEVGGATSKLTEELEEGFGWDTERSALGGREVAGIGCRKEVEACCEVDESVEEE
jgi:hypothetical protein